MPIDYRIFSTYLIEQIVWNIFLSGQSFHRSSKVNKFVTFTCLTSGFDCDVVGDVGVVLKQLNSSRMVRIRSKKSSILEMSALPHDDPPSRQSVESSPPVS